MREAAITISVSVIPSMASSLEPVSPSGNFEAVCRYLKPVVSTSEAMVKNKGSVSQLFSRFSNELYDLAFSAETRATVDADDLFVFVDSWLSQPGDDSWNTLCDIAYPQDDFIDFKDFATLAIQLM